MILSEFEKMIEVEQHAQKHVELDDAYWNFAQSLGFTVQQAYLYRLFALNRDMSLETNHSLALHFIEALWRYFPCQD